MEGVGGSVKKTGEREDKTQNVHAWPTLRPLIPHNSDDVGRMRDQIMIQRIIQCILLIEAPRHAREGRPFLPRDLRHRPARREVPAQDLDMARGFDGVGERADDGLVRLQGGEGSDVFG